MNYLEEKNYITPDKETVKKVFQEFKESKAAQDAIQKLYPNLVKELEINVGDYVTTDNHINHRVVEFVYKEGVSSFNLINSIGVPYYSNGYNTLKELLLSINLTKIDSKQA